MPVCLNFKRAILSQPLRKSKQKEFLTIVENFLRTPKHFAFINRLCWVEMTLQKLRLKAKKNTKAISIIEGIWAYYSNFIGFCLERYKDMFKGIDKPIKEIEKLSNWHMDDFVNQRMNITKYHRGINRAMKSHKEILDMKASVSVIDEKRKSYLHADEDNFVSRLESDGFVYEGELSIYEEETEEVVEKELHEKALILADKRAGVHVEVIKERKKKEIKPRVNRVLSKNMIDKFVETYMKHKAGDVEQKVVNLLVRDLRLLRPQEWMNLMMEESKTTKKELKYKDYQNGCDVLEEEIDMWFTQLVELKVVKNRPIRERALMDFLKTMRKFEFSFAPKIANFEVDELFINMKGSMMVLSQISHKEE